MENLTASRCAVLGHLFLTVHAGRTLLVDVLVVHRVVLVSDGILADSTGEISPAKTGKTNQVSHDFVVRTSEVFCFFQGNLAIVTDKVFNVIVSVLGQNHVLISNRKVACVAGFVAYLKVAFFTVNVMVWVKVGLVGQIGVFVS